MKTLENLCIHYIIKNKIPCLKLYDDLIEKIKKEEIILRCGKNVRVLIQREIALLHPTLANFRCKHSHIPINEIKILNMRSMQLHKYDTASIRKNHRIMEYVLYYLPQVQN